MTDQSWGDFAPSKAVTLAHDLVAFRIARGPIKRRLRRYAFDRYRRAEAVDITIEGIKFRCYPGDNTTERKMVERDFRDERANIALIIDPLQPGDTFIDIGANCGVFALFAARNVGPTGKVVAIEPQPNMIRRLSQNAAFNDLQNIVIEPIAASAEVGSVTLHVTPHQQGKSSIAPRENTAPLTIRTEPLLSILNRNGVDRIQSLKIDVEGHEDQTLLPFFRDARRAMHPRYIFMEVQNRERWRTDCVKEISTIGYRVEFMTETDALLTRTSA